MKPVYLLLALALVLAGCSSAQPAVSTPAQTIRPSAPTGQPAPTANTPSPEADPASSPAPSPAGQDWVRIDEQGAVVVEVTPLDLADPGGWLEFEVVLNTHTVDLSMDLAALAALTTDDGKTVPASQWDAPRGGHHVTGKLIFPATVDGQPVLAGAQELTLTVRDLDAPERTFTWELDPPLP